jgi:alkylhydroperoxidase family enzyme
LFDEPAALLALAGNVEGPEFNSRERAAVRYAEVMHTDPRVGGGSAIATLREQFSDAEVIELSFTIAQFISMGQLIHAMGVPNPDVLEEG